MQKSVGTRVIWSSFESDISDSIHPPKRAFTPEETPELLAFTTHVCHTKQKKSLLKNLKSLWRSLAIGRRP
ncbi:MAG: uncharacterized protein KVP18_003150 [Porospora cf. gigantea A]|uniref:uncharacterized protein n=1 Tax=Porospora cf. gigantea A TaxID=2853593 RepID=UPI00355958C9|nr:MAG: hypothetical protein KVP18_003150 [Porospora cf. gigantea A]